MKKIFSETITIKQLWILMAVSYTVVIGGSIVFWRYFGYKSSNVTVDNIKSADSTMYYKDKHNRVWAYSRTLETELEDAKRITEGQSKELAKLAAEMNRNTRMATSANIEVSGRGAAKSSVKSSKSAAIQDTQYMNPVYHGVIMDSFSTIDVIADQDSIRAKYKFTVPLIVKMKRQRGGLFGRDVDYVYWSSGNPYAEITSVRSIAVPHRVRRWGVGPYIGYGIGPSGLQPTVGIGIQWNAISW